MKEVKVAWIEEDEAMVDSNGQAFTPLDWYLDIEDILSTLESELLPHGLQLVIGKNTDDGLLWFRIDKKED